MRGGKSFDMLRKAQRKKVRALTPDERSLARVFREMDNGRPPVEEDDESLEAIQKVIREYRNEKRCRQK